MKRAKSLNMTPVAERPKCHLCGKVLRENTRMESRPEENGNPYAWVMIGTGKFGYGGDGLFCTLNCGYLYARRVLRKAIQAAA